MSTRVLTAHIPEELAEKVDRYAESMERSRAWIVKQALSNWVDWEEQKLQMTLDALDAADRGELVDDDAVRLWIESLDTDNPLPLPSSKK
ncbi:CopG family transcriptional regulator [Devosia sp. Root413D1]|uniref:CopG family ribbon-helix-helix protein n=1 Tax=Devosia sp. Root413D1 TaxID=1736531 RepID=UPI0006FA1348|nr:ribbon-helix-helix domain-containing protein [Devosia sp. Root413D1]KQW81370.1 CopG family transcriptional regulator [Devosia sp. Root413D1]